MTVIRLLVCLPATLFAAGCSVQPIDLIPASELALIEREPVADIGRPAAISVQTLLARARGDLDHDAEALATPTLPAAASSEVRSGERAGAAVRMPEPVAQEGLVPAPQPPSPEPAAPAATAEAAPAGRPIGVDELLARVRAIDEAQRGKPGAKGT